MQLDSSIPKYEVTYRTILSRLKSGHYSVGSRIPTEGEFAKHFDISRVTVRRALEMLVRDGYIKSRQGSGYIVLTLSPASDTCLTSFTDAMLRAGREPTSKLLSITNFPGKTTKMDFLPDGMSTVEITRINRLRLVDTIPHMLVLTYVPSSFLDKVKPQDFPNTGSNQSILRILGARFNLQWSAACEDISPILADNEMATMLDVEVGVPLLKHACTAFNEQGAAVFHEQVFRAGSISFHLSQQSRLPVHN